MPARSAESVGLRAKKCGRRPPASPLGDDAGDDDGDDGQGRVVGSAAGCCPDRRGRGARALGEPALQRAGAVRHLDAGVETRRRRPGTGEDELAAPRVEHLRVGETPVPDAREEGVDHRQVERVLGPGVRELLGVVVGDRVVGGADLVWALRLGHPTRLDLTRVRLSRPSRARPPNQRPARPPSREPGSATQPEPAQPTHTCSGAGCDRKCVIAWV